MAIASEGESEDSEISTRAGRAPFYLIFEDGELVEKWKNPFSRGGGGAGWSVAYKMHEKDVGKLFAGRFGGNMKQALEEKGIDYEEGEGKVKDFK